MNKNRKIKRVWTAGLAVGMSVMLCPVQTFAAGSGTACREEAAADTEDTGKGISADVEKDETVYVNADASGMPESVTVSDWLKNAGSEENLRDMSRLEDIKNLKGDESFAANGDTLTWETAGKDIYYQGTSDEQLPVDVKLTYYLDGKETGPEELKGKSGQLKIRIDYTNRAENVIEAGGGEAKAYTPFVLVTGLILPNETFSNVVIDNGRILSDGDRNIVLGFAMPGLKESLGLNDFDDAASELSIPESLEITADVTDLTMPSTYTAALPDLFGELDVNDIADLESLRNSLDEREDAALALVSGSEELSEGAGTLADGVDSYTDGADELCGAIQKYMGPDGELGGSVAEYTDGVNSIVQGISDYASGAEALSAGVVTYVEGEEQLAAGAEDLTKLAEGLTQVQEAVSALSDATTGDISSASQTLADATEQLKQALGSEGVQNMLSQAEAMLQSGSELVEEAGAMGNSLTSGIEKPLEDISASLVNLSGELDRISTAKETLQNACDAVNSVVDSDNDKINTARNAASESETQIRNSIAVLAEQKDALGDTEEEQEAAQQIQAAIDALTGAQGAAGALEGIENLERVSVDLTDLDFTAIQTAAGEIRSEMTAFTETAADLSGQLSDLKQKLGELESAKDALPVESLGSLAAKVDALNQGMQDLNSAISGTGGLADSLSALDQSVSSQFPAALEGIDALNDGFSQLGSYNEALRSGADQLASGGPELRAGAVTLAGGTKDLVSGLDTLGGQLAAGASALSANSGTLRSGASALESGALTLKKGMAEFESRGTGKMKEMLENELGEVLDRLDALTSEACSYDTFSGKSDEMDGNVKFIIETAPVE